MPCFIPQRYQFSTTVPVSRMPIAPVITVSTANHHAHRWIDSMDALKPMHHLQNSAPRSSAGAKIWLNAAPAKRIENNLLSLLDLCIVNRIEAEFYDFDNEEKIKNNLTIIKTLGHQGLEMIETGGSTQKIPAFNVNVVSSHGAGDMFIGALAARYLEGDPIESALKYAQGAAALHISRPENERKEITPKKVSDFIRSYS